MCDIGTNYIKTIKATTLFVVFLFVHSWEQRKFEDAFIERREKTVTENEDTLLSCAINGMFLNSELFGHFRGTTTIGYLKVKKNDLILSAQNLHLGNANVNLRFEHGIISPAYKVYDLNNCEPEFVQAWVKKEDTKNFFLAATTEGASQCRKNIEWDTLGKQIICMPAIKEQATIGSFFKCVDNLITLHQCESCKKVGAVQSAFARRNLSKWADSWEQRKAKELCSISTGKSNTQDQVDDGKYPFYIRSDIPVRSNKYLYDCEAVITIGDGNIGRVFHYVNGKFDLHQRCYKMTDFQDIWGKYFFYYFSTKFYERAMKMTAKATVDSVRLEMISEMDIKQPFQISEQKQIAEFFDYLNNLITLHQRQLEKLKNIKSALLEKMFV